MHKTMSWTTHAQANAVDISEIPPATSRKSEDTATVERSDPSGAGVMSTEMTVRIATPIVVSAPPTVSHGASRKLRLQIRMDPHPTANTVVYT